MNAPQLLFVIYDSIHHSIFEGQVLAPLIKKLNAEIYKKIHIVSFEEKLSPTVLNLSQTITKRDPRITITLFKRPRFIAQIFLWQQSYQLKKILKKIPGNYQVCARGPLAGIIAKQAATPLYTALTIQARGLLAQEHSYTHKKSSGITALLHALRTQQLFYVEKNAYTPLLLSSCSFSIETVSEALKTYLVATYSIPENIFTIPMFDTPEQVSPEEKLFYRDTIRTTLHIPKDATVYVYNGSLKPWQCPQETIITFKNALAKNNRALFLALTQDQQQMHLLLEQADLPETAFRILHVPQHEVTRYLCAADYGILLREPHPLNWVSRPTKLLEYQAAGLEIIHNNTIAIVSK